MTVVTDAEYTRMTPIEKARYWANRYQDLELKYQDVTEENYILKRILKQIKNAVGQVEGL